MAFFKICRAYARVIKVFCSYSFERPNSVVALAVRLLSSQCHHSKSLSCGGVGFEVIFQIQRKEMEESALFLTAAFLLMAFCDLAFIFDFTTSLFARDA